MDFDLSPNLRRGSPSSSTSSASPKPSNPGHHHQNGAASSADPMHTWWESVSKARTRIHLLSSLLSPSTPDSLLSSLADSDHPAKSLLLSSAAYAAVSSSLSSPSSGSGDDPLCHWIYDTFLSSDPDLCLVVLSYIPLIASIYLSRIHASALTTSTTPSLSGFEAVLLALYSSEIRSRNGKPQLISIPDLSQPSLYHTPKNLTSSKSNPNPNSKPLVGVLSPPLEPQMAVKSTKRACIVGVALECFYKQISQMPSWSKLDFCNFAADWAGEDCSCMDDFDETDVKIESFEEDGDEDIDGVVEEMGGLGIEEEDESSRPKGVRIPLPWELLQPLLRILGHCLLGPLISQDVKHAASLAVRRLYARASHDLVLQAILATRSLIQLEKRVHEAAKAAAAASAASNANTPIKAKKPEILLVSK